MALAATRKATRIRSLWPSRDLRPPPPPKGPEPATASTSPGPGDEGLPLRSLTANELIAMARAARARSGEAGLQE